MENIHILQPITSLLGVEVREMVAEVHRGTKGIFITMLSRCALM